MDVDSFYFKIKQIKPGRLREVKQLARGHTAAKQKARLEAMRMDLGEGGQWVPMDHEIVRQKDCGSNAR